MKDNEKRKRERKGRGARGSQRRELMKKSQNSEGIKERKRNMGGGRGKGKERKRKVMKGKVTEEIAKWRENKRYER